MCEDTIFIIPKPVKCEVTSQEFDLKANTSIVFLPLFQPIANYLHDLLSSPTGMSFTLEEFVAINSHRQAIILIHDSSSDRYGEEGYSLLSTSDQVVLKANSLRGMFYAVQSLRQLLPVEIESRTVCEKSWAIPGVDIFDYPRFSWRGFMFDEGRHFHGKHVVKRFLDLMALHKLNVFHWHLTEDQGWRIEIKKYPRLTQVGAKRQGSQIGGYKSFFRKKRSLTPHEGFYSQEDIKEVIEYAQSRYILVVPEIDLPGHTRALLAAYPEYSCTGDPLPVATDWGVFKDVLCPGKEHVFTLIEDVLNEVVPLFPDPYFHIGGDEAPKDRWIECPDCQNRIEEETLPDEHALQEYFTSRVVQLLKSMNKIPIGWNEILSQEFDDLDSDVIIQHWLGGTDRVLNHLRHGRRIIRSNFFYTYLDYPYVMTPLKKSYQYDPIPSGLEEEFQRNILGIEAPLWTEWVPSVSRIDWQAFPRLTALSEIAWSPKEKDYPDFRKRLKNFLLRLDHLGVKYAKEQIVDPGRIKRFFTTPIMLFKDPQKNVSD